MQKHVEQTYFKTMKRCKWSQNTEKKKKKMVKLRGIDQEVLKNYWHSGLVTEINEKIKFVNHGKSVLFLPLLLQLLSLVNSMNGSDFTIVEATIVDIQCVFAEGRLTSLQLVDFYLNMIESLNPCSAAYWK